MQPLQGMWGVTGGRSAAPRWDAAGAGGGCGWLVAGVLTRRLVEMGCSRLQVVWAHPAQPQCRILIGSPIARTCQPIVASTACARHRQRLLVFSSARESVAQSAAADAVKLPWKGWHAPRATATADYACGRGIFFSLDWEGS